MKKVCVIGLGYIGIPTAVIAAQAGYDVLGLDIDEEKVQRINNQDPVIDEVDLSHRLKEVVLKGTFKASMKIESSDCFIICVPTPITKNKTADLSFVFSAAEEVAKVVKKGDLILLESTVPVGTTRRLKKFIFENSGVKDFLIAFCPERVLPGKIVFEVVHNDRLVGGIDDRSSEAGKNFYAKFVKGNISCTDDKTAEMTKLVENSYRDVNIAFAHQIAAQAESEGLDPYQLIELANKHPRVNILKPTIGVGGHCISVDPWFLAETFPGDSGLLVSARKINDQRPFQIINKINKILFPILSSNLNVAVFGLSYKPDVGDIRESPAMFIAEQLKMYNVNLMIVDPHISKNLVETKFPLAEFCTIEKAIKEADVLIGLVAHSVFKSISQEKLKNKLVLDFCQGFNDVLKEDQFVVVKEKNEASLS